MANESAVKKPSLGIAILPVIFLVACLYVGLVVLEADPQIPLILGTIFATFIAIRLGHTWKHIEDRMIATISLAMQANLILMTVGILIGTWMISGTVPILIYYGLQLISPTWFLVTACLVCCVVSVACSSSWSTAGTVGVALIGIAYGLGINPALAAGAIISGAYFGDKITPHSDTTNLASAMTGTPLFDHIRHMQWSTVPSLLIALILYTILGFGTTGSAEISEISEILYTIEGVYNITPLAIIPPILIILIVVFKIPALPGLYGGIFAAILIAYITQWSHYDGFMDMTAAVVDAMHYGFSIETDHEMVDTLLNRGGLDSMMWTVSLILCAMCFGGVLEMSGCLNTIAESMLQFAKNNMSLVFVTLFSCVAVNILCSDQYLSLVVPGRMYRKEYIKRGLDPKNLARNLEDGGTLTSALIPWNTCGAAMAGFLGVATLEYLPYVFMNLSAPVVALILAATGIGMAKLTPEDQARLLAEMDE